VGGSWNCGKRPYTLESGEKREEGDVCGCHFMGARRSRGEYEKGRPVFIEGGCRLNLGRQTVRTKGSKLKVIGETMQMLGSPARRRRCKRGDEGERSGEGQTHATAQTRKPAAEADKDEIPF